MPSQIKIVITKEIIEHCKNCGNKNDEYEVGKNCAVAFALVDIFPDVVVTNYCFYPFGVGHGKENPLIPLPPIAQQFIKLFDAFALTPGLRLLLPEFEFTIDIPDEIIELINIDEVRDLIKEDKRKHSVVQSTNNLITPARSMMLTSLP